MGCFNCQFFLKAASNSVAMFFTSGPAAKECITMPSGSFSTSPSVHALTRVQLANEDEMGVTHTTRLKSCGDLCSGVFVSAEWLSSSSVCACIKWVQASLLDPRSSDLWYLLES